MWSQVKQKKDVFSHVTFPQNFNRTSTISYTCRFTSAPCHFLLFTLGEKQDTGNFFSSLLKKFALRMGKAGFEWCTNILHSDDVSVRIIYETLNESGEHPSFFVYSKSVILQNMDAYKTALGRLSVPSLLGFSIKANYNPSILRVFSEAGCHAIAVSGNEVDLALHSGFSCDR